MSSLNRRRRLATATTSIVVVLLLLPGAAGAKFPLESESGAAEPGVTVTGLGFAPAAPDAVARAIGDARRRALAIARELDVELGAVEAVELPELNQFGTPFCPRQRGTRPGCRPPRLRAAAARVTFGILGGASGEEAARTVTAGGGAELPVRPTDSQRSTAIKRAVFAARRDVVPKAARVARRSAVVAAQSAGLTLGAIVSVEEATPYYYGPSFYDPALGSFGPGRFCGLARVPVIRRDPETGISRVVRRVVRRRCFAPRSYSLHLEVRYEAS
jgi:hypothetical protein